MKLKQPSKLPTGKSYHRFDEGHIDFDNGQLTFATFGVEETLQQKETKALFTSMLMHYMADGDTDLFE